MSEDSSEPPEGTQDAGGRPPEEAAQVGEDGGAGRRARRACTWGKLLLLALSAAVLGAFVAANWREESYSVVYAFVEVNAGIVILASAVWGFVVGALFIWSATSRQE